MSGHKILGEEFKSPKPFAKGEVNRTNPNAQEIHDLLAIWDRQEFGNFCRKLEILMLRGKIEAAKLAVSSFYGFNAPVPPKPEDHVALFLPLRIANALEENGYFTIGQALRASEQELRAIPNISHAAIRAIQAVGVACKNQTPMAKVIEVNCPDLLPEWDIDWDYLAKIE